MSTAIFFLLTEGEVSRWHKVDAAKVWHHYLGAALELSMAGPGEGVTKTCLGPDIWASQTPQAVVPAGYWQQACSLGNYSLVGCTVALGFMFEGLEMAPAGFVPGDTI